MKSILITVIFILSQNAVIFAQSSGTENTTSPPHEMEVLRPWEGSWEGSGTINRSGQQQTFKIDEEIVLKLNGRILVVEGIGKDTQEAKERIVHHAFGVLHFDAASKKYTFNTWLADGKHSQAWFEITDSSTYQWGFNVPSGKIRYTIVINPEATTWDETGEYSSDGKSWFPFLEMHLKKVR